MSETNTEKDPMSSPTEPTTERRGSRRTHAKPWRCQGTRPGVPVQPVGAYAPPVPCDAGPENRVEDELGHVWCSWCGTLDRRSTAGNRRRARAELAQLERRIERELHETKLRLTNLEHHVREAYLELPAARAGKS